MKTTHDIRTDFPVFHNNKGLVYLDSAATSLKPKQVIDKVVEYYEHYSANIHRGLYNMSERATEEYEESRKVVASFIGADVDEIIFTRNTTEGLNLVAYALGRELLTLGSEVVTTVMEHHSNFVPWQQLSFENGTDFKVIDITADGILTILDPHTGKPDIHELEKIISKRTKILALTYVSNVLGTINPVKEIISIVKKINPKIITVVDGAQAIQHMPVNVKELGCDFFSFSSHKMFGPTGVGVLYGKKELLSAMYPFLYGGEMVDVVSIESTTFKSLPHKYEAGTPHISGVIALKEAVRYIQAVGWEYIEKHEAELTEYALRSLDERFGKNMRIIGSRVAKGRVGAISFTLEGFHPHDVAQILDESQIAVRAGNHCAMPLHTRFGLPATTRASLSIYNEKADIDALIAGLEKVKKTLSR